jgi:hypothetical protein
LGRAERESIGEWVERVTRNDDVLARELKGLAGLHYRYRFDPIGSSIEQRQVLDQACGIWLNNRAAAGATA